MDGWMGGWIGWLHTMTSVPGKNKAIAKALSGALHPSQSGERNTSCID